jgi:response regulator RpfG family c-di-GMP phosphodiesterase
MADRILFVDDDERLLKAVRRSLGKRYKLDTALGPDKALEWIEQCGPYAVVVSDLKMPGKDGISLLEDIRNIHGDTVRVVLTGYADLNSAVDAVNRGNVFRFLTKPCETKTLAAVLDDCLRQYQLLTSERELLEQTLKGCISVLSETLSLVNPEAFGRANRVARFARAIAQQAGVDNVWKYEMAAMLSQIGCVVLPEQTLQKLTKGVELKPEERQLYDMHPLIGRNLLSRIPRLEDVAEMVAYQEKNFDGSGIPPDGVEGEEIPFGARILRVAIDFDAALNREGVFAKAFHVLESHMVHYDPFVLHYLESCLGKESHFEAASLNVKELRHGMILDQSVVTEGGLHLLRKGRELNSVLIQKLRAVHKRMIVVEPVKVLIPVVEHLRDDKDIRDD